MEKLSFWNRLLGIAISAGTLTSVLFFSGCITSRKSSTAVRSDSTRYNVTVVSTIEPVRIKMTDLLLTPEHLTRLTELPKGYSLQAQDRDEGSSILRVESDGKGGLNIISESSPVVLKKDSIVREVETRIRDETRDVQDKAPVTSEKWVMVMLIVFFLLYLKK